MNLDPGTLRRFEKRVRVVRAWRGLGIGALVGSALCVLWSSLDWLRYTYTEWAWMGAVVLGLGLLGAVHGYFSRVSRNALSASIDRRGGLKDRLTTSMEVAQENVFGNALQADASERLSKLKPNELYPVRLGRMHAGTLALSLLASTIFLLGNSPILVSPEKRKEREELKKIGESVERIAKPLTEHDRPDKLTDSERRMAEELRKLQRDLQRSKIEKEEALQKANELSKQTEELVKERAEMTSENMEKAESALEKLQRAELEKAGMKMDPETLKALREMNRMNSKEGKPGENSKADLAKQTQQKLDKLNKEQQVLEQKMGDLEAQQEQLKSKLQDIQSKLKSPNLTPEQRKALEEMQKKIEEMLKGLEKELADIQKAVAQIMKNKEVQELMKKINEHPKMKELQELAAKLAENAKVGEQGDIPQLTKEDIEAMKERLKEAEAQLKELAKELQDPQALEEYLEQLRQALENMDQLELNAGMCLACLNLFNLPLPGLPSPSNPIDFMTNDTGKINKNENGKEGQGKTTLTQIKGDRQDKGDESYIEIKGPTTVGNKSGVKYNKVLPSYKKKAEEAINRKSIPKQHEKRVREYFESLTGGK